MSNHSPKSSQPKPIHPNHLSALALFKPKKSNLPVHRHAKLAPNQIDRTGEKYNRLTILAYRGQTPYCRHATWLCVCECGRIRDKVTLSDLRTGKVRHCPTCARERSGRPKKNKTDQPQDFA